MTEQICPACSCSVAGEGYEKEGAKYCCEPCATASPCTCGCCHEVKEAHKK